MNIKSFFKGIRRGRRTRLIVAITVIAIVAPLVANTILQMPKEAEASWYSDSWGFRKKLTIDYTKVSGDQTNFPVLVSFTDASLAKAQSDGDDILFTDSTGTGTKLDHEIEKFDQSTNTLVAWVEIPSLSSSVNTIIYMYYGNQSITSQQNVSGVWDANYVAVYHLPENSGQHADSKGVNNTNSVTVTQQGANIGKVDGADEFNGTSDVLTALDHSSLDVAGDITLEAWVKLDTLPSQRGPAQDAMLIRKANAISPFNPYQLRIKSSGNVDMIGFDLYDSSDNFMGNVGQTALTTGSWYYVAGTRNGTSTSVYLNGDDDTNAPTNNSTAIVNGNSTLRIGASSGTVSRTDGIIDEIRISSDDRSAGWITTTFNTINSPSTFFSKGIEEKSRGPILYYSFDEGYGTSTIADSSPGGNTGTLAGATKPTWQTEDMCVSGKCLYYNGSTSSVTVSNTINNVQSVSFWVKPKTNGETLLDLDGGTHALSASGGTISATGFSSPTIYVNGQESKNLTANNWQHITVTTATRFNASSIKIGNVSSAYLNGFVDEFKIYDYVRTASQVKSDYAGRGSVQGTSASYGPDNIYLSQGLVGYWKMDDAGVDAEGETSTDSSGNSNSGTLYGDNNTGDNGTGMDCTASGKLGTGCNFDGVDDYFSASDNNSLDASTQITVAAWVYVTSYGSISSYPRIIIKSGAYDLHMYTYVGGEGRLEWDIRIPSETDLQTGATNAIPLTTWTHIAATYDGTASRIYINGVEVAKRTDISGNLTNSGAGLGIGATSTGAASFPGKIDEARVYNRALSPGEITNLYNFAPGPVGYWKLDENTGQSANDSSGTGNNGTLGVNSSAGSDDPAWTDGKFGNALKFDGTDDFVTTGLTSPELGANDYTVGFWFKTNSTANNRNFFDDWQNNDRSLLIRIADGFIQQYVGSGTSTLTGNNSAAFTDTASWHYLTATHIASSQTLKLYLDGVKVDEDTYTGTRGVSTQTFLLGKSPVGDPFAGQMDDVKIYNYARTPGQIIEDMNAGHPAPGSPVGSAVAHWQFDEGYLTTANDSTDNNNDLTLNSASWTNSGKFGKAWNGTGGNIRLSKTTDSDLEFSATDSFTLSTWFKSDTVGVPAAAEYLMADGGPAGSAGYALYINTSGYACFGIDDDTSWGPDISSCNTTNVYDNIWHHLIAVRDVASDKTYLYIDGVLKDSDTDSTSATLDASPTFYIGDIDTDNAASGEEFAGDIDETKVFRLAMTADQVITEYNQGQGTVMGAQSSSSTNVVFDTFNRSNGALGNTESPTLSWSGSTWTISSNKAINTPNLGSELISNGSFETGNPPDNWSVMQGTPATFERSGTQVQDGTYSMHVITDGVNENVAQDPNLTNDVWYTSTGYFYPVTSGDWQYFYYGTGDPFIYIPTGQWNKLTFINKADSIGYIRIGPTYANEFYFDNVSTKALTLNELFATVQSNKSNVTAEAAITLESTLLNRTPTGFVLRLDNKDNPQNFLLAYVDGYGANNWGKVTLLKYVNGTYTQLFSSDLYPAGAMYTAGKILKVVMNGSLVQVYYDNYLVNSATVSDSSIINNTIHGLFSTYSGNSIDNFSLKTNSINYDYCVPGDTANCSAPVAEWKLDEGTGANANDTSGNGLTGTITGAIWNNGKHGQGIRFDGVNDLILLPNSSLLKFSLTQDFSIGAWINTTTTSDSDIYFKHSYGYINTYGLMVSSTNKAKVVLQDENAHVVNCESTSSINDGRWHYVYGVRNSADDSVYIYIDGVKENSCNDTTTGPVNRDADNYIGNDYYNNNPLNGLIDEVRIYNYARTPAQIAWDYNRGAPVAQYDFDECTGNTLHDTAPKSDKNVTGTNGTIYPQTGNNVGTCGGSAGDMWADGATGKYSSSLDFDGTDDYIDAGNDSSLTFTSGFSAAAWIKLNSSYSPWVAILGKEIWSPGSGWTIYISSSGGSLSYSKGGGSTITANNAVPSGLWKHVVITNDNGNAKIFINGIEKANGSVPIDNASTNLFIGSRHGNTGTGTLNHFPGQIDDVRIYNYALTAEQVKNVYNNGSAVQFGQ
ncbi:MAG TPA: DUF2341 domain-containing protein [Patescibacteria group bacterium]|nr:DUF2341 domain-containing protein [Patescibacteria group bacterium]